MALPAVYLSPVVVFFWGGGSNESQEHPIGGQLSSTAHCLSNIQGRESNLSGPTCVNREFPVSVQTQGS